MLRKYAKTSIIVVIQLFAWSILLLLITPFLIQQRNHLADWHNFFESKHTLFFLSHGLFYVSLYIAWPHVIHFLAHREITKPSAQQIKNALGARYYLLGAFLLFELLNLMR